MEPEASESNDDEYNRAINEDESLARSETLKKKGEGKNDYIVSYSSVNRLRFEFLCSVLVCYDCVMLPFSLSFELLLVFSPGVMVMHNIINTFIRLIYLMDFCLCFRKAYLDERVGQEVRDPWRIFKRYVRFLFWVDLMSIIPFDLFSQSFSLYSLQLIKIIRLLRLSKIITFLNVSSTVQSRTRLMYIVMSFFIIIHWATCFMYF